MGIRPDEKDEDFECGPRIDIYFDSIYEPLSLEEIVC